MAGFTKTQRTLLAGVEEAARAVRKGEIVRDNLIARAVGAGLTQTRVAEAAEMSQAHVSRMVSMAHEAKHRRDATRRPKSGARGGTV